jgi:LPXTG-motif cell wall-anchored protein
MYTNHARRGPLTTLGLGIGMALLAATVLAPNATATDLGDGSPVPIAEGRDGIDVVGQATFDIVEDGLLRVRIALDEGVELDEAHLCLSTTEYTERIPHGLCPWKIEGPDGEFPPIDLSEHDGEAIFAQLHVALTGGGGAFAGHQNPGTGAFYGNVKVREAVIQQSPSTEIEGPSTSNDDDPDDEGPGVGTGGGDVTGDPPPAGPSGPVDPAPQAGSPQVPEAPEVGEADLPPLPSPPRSAPVPVAAPVPGDGVTLIDPVSLDRLAGPPAAPAAQAPAAPAPAGERSTEVLGIQLERAAGSPAVAGQSLPRTGTDTPVLIWSAVGLLLAGAGLVLLGGRAAGHVAAP